MNILSFVVIAAIVFISIHKFQAIVASIQEWSTEPGGKPQEVKTLAAAVLLLAIVGTCAGFSDAGVSPTLEASAIAAALLGRGLLSIYNFFGKAVPPYGNH